jgi:hypothetical protein
LLWSMTNPGRSFSPPNLSTGDTPSRRN